MTARKPNPRKPRRNAKGQYMKPRRRPEDAQTKSEMVGYETHPPHILDEPPKTRAHPEHGEPVGYETSAPREATSAAAPTKPRAPLESAPYGPRRDASGAAPMTPLPASFDAESYGCGPANWEPPRAVVESRYTMRSMFAVWRRWLRRRS